MARVPTGLNGFPRAVAAWAGRDRVRDRLPGAAVGGGGRQGPATSDGGDEDAEAPPEKLGGVP